MQTDTHVFFFGHAPHKLGYNIFSQWYPVEFTDDIAGEIIQYCNTEQFMMAQKAILFDDAENLAKILVTNDPSKIKQYGRKIKNFDDKEWNKYKFDIVTQGNRLKFGQNPNLMKKLLKTGNKTIVEASPYDKVWGIGLTASQAVKIPENKWPGSNLLGKALMVVRSENQ